MRPLSLLIGLLTVVLCWRNAHADEHFPANDTAARPGVHAPVKKLVAHVKVEGMIDGGLAAFMERAMSLAEQERADAFLIEMNTYGGRVDAADVIRMLLLNAKMLTITFIHTNAASAGALIAMATDTIVMSPGSAIGAATPVDATGTPASSKVISYFRSIMGETARAKGRNPRIAEAMVDSTVVVSGLEDAARPLTLRTDQAIDVGIAQQQANSIEEVLRLNGLEGATVESVETNWAEHIVRFLSNPLVSGLLLTIGALGLIYELTTPGFWLPGIVGVVCLTLFFGSHWIVKLAEWWEVLVFIIGVVLIVIELFVPGGILGIIGVGLVVTGLFLSLVGKIKLAAPADFTNAFTSLGTALVLTFAGSLALLKGFASIHVFKRFTLDTRQRPGRGDVPTATVARNGLLGKQGVADTPLRPSGRVIVEGRYLDAVTNGEHIDIGTPVKVVAVEGLRGVVVRAL